jgi:hypothetical protein
MVPSTALENCPDQPSSCSVPPQFSKKRVSQLHAWSAVRRLWVVPLLAMLCSLHWHVCYSPNLLQPSTGVCELPPDRVLVLDLLALVGESAARFPLVSSAFFLLYTTHATRQNRSEPGVSSSIGIRREDSLINTPPFTPQRRETPLRLTLAPKGGAGREEGRGTWQTLRGHAHASRDGSSARPRQWRWNERTQKLQQTRRPLRSPHSVQSSSFSSCCGSSLSAAVAGAGWAGEQPRAGGGSCGVPRGGHSVQNTLPGAFAAGLVQPWCWQRLPPPCDMQRSVPPERAPLVQPSSWQRLPPPCALQWGVPPL